MNHTVERCRHCGAVIPKGATVYGDHNCKFCSESCACAQLDIEQGTGHHAVASRSREGSPDVGDRVGPDRGPARRRGGGPTMR
jgi:hypothetical protein